MVEKVIREPSEDELNKKVEEGLFPELSPTTVCIGDISVNIIEMPVFYVKQLNRKLAPFYAMLTGTDVTSIDMSKIINADNIDKFYDEFLDAAWFIVNYHQARENNVKTMEIEELSKIAPERLLLNIIVTQLEANGHANFFKSILKGVMSIASGLQQKST